MARHTTKVDIAVAKSPLLSPDLHMQVSVERNNVTLAIGQDDRKLGSQNMSTSYYLDNKPLLLRENGGPSVD